MTSIDRWQKTDRNDVIELIVGIQRGEFDLPITADDQPDLVDVDDFYRRDGGDFWVARNNGAVVGTIAAIVIEENTAVIRKMFVDSSQRATGLAGELMSTLVAWARRNGYRTLLLGTTDRMTAAHRFYAKHEFVEVAADSLPAEFPRMGVDTVFFKRELPGVVSIRQYNPAWPAMFEIQKDLITGALPDIEITVEHTGSTSVPGLSAKPFIDITMTVPDTREEDVYFGGLESLGYRYVLREEDWFEHRLFVREWPRVNLHIFPAGCSEVDRMLLFRDWLRSHPRECELYESVKRDLAGREWTNVQDYADAKTEVVAEILARATAASADA